VCAAAQGFLSKETLFAILPLPAIEKFELAATFKTEAEKVIFADCECGVVNFLHLTADERFEFARRLMHMAKFFERLGFCHRGSEVAKIIQESGVQVGE
jgi:hypothetical protein